MRRVGFFAFLGVVLVGNLAAPTKVVAETSAARLVSAAREQIGVTVAYDGGYEKIRYPGGDVSLEKGVCTDVVIRAYRKLGIDLQQKVHEDMLRSFAAYPSGRLWGLKAPDSNIDHRRVPNLQTFFRRQHAELPTVRDRARYQSGDLVTWNLPGNLPHVGIISDKASSTDAVPLIIHNIGQGVVEENILFTYEITGHYRYFPTEVSGAD